MVNKVLKTEQGLAVLIPKEILEQLGLTPDSKVSIKLNQELSQIIITPASSTFPRVEETLVQYHDDAGVIETAAVAKTLPGVDEEFAQQIAEFIEQYRPALEALAK